MSWLTLWWPLFNVVGVTVSHPMVDTSFVCFEFSCAYPALILRCSQRVLSHFLSPFLSRLLSSYRFPITVGPQSQLAAQEILSSNWLPTELPRSASEAPNDDNDAMIATKDIPKQNTIQLKNSSQEDVPSGGDVAGITAPDVCTGLSVLV